MRGRTIFVGICLFFLAAFCVYTQNLPPSGQGQTAPPAAPSINGAVNPTQFAGSDIGAQIDAAFAACAGNTIHLRIPPGKYSFTTPIVFTGACIPQIDAEGVEMDYRGRGQAITFSGLNIAGGFAGPKVLRGMHLAYTGRGSRSVIGIAVGDTSGAACCAAGIRLENVWIDNFGTDLLFGSNAWNFSATGDFFSASGTGRTLVSVPSGTTNSGESLRFSNSTFFSSGSFLANAINVSNGGTSSSWDGDNFDNVEVEFLAGNNDMASPYWENPDAAIPSGHFFLVAGATGALFDPYFFANRGWAGGAPHFMANITGSWSTVGSQAKSRDASPCTAFYRVAALARLNLAGTQNGCSPAIAVSGGNIAQSGLNATSVSGNDAAALKHVRASSTCTTSAALGAACTFTVNLPGAPFPDTNFTATCTAAGATTGVPILSVRAATTSQLTLQIQAASPAAATVAGADCIAVHD